MTQSTDAPNSEVPAPIAMLQMLSGFWISKAIYAVAKLGIADYLLDSPKTAEELAAITETHPPSLYRLLRALASVGIFAEDDNHNFSLTPLAATLQTDVPGSLRFFAISELGTDHSIGWNNLLHSLKTGGIAFDNAAGMNVWEYYAQHPEESNAFDRAMTNLTAVVVAAILSSYDFSEFQNIVDIGGGQGSLISQILKANPKLKGIVFDLPQVIEDTKLRLQTEDIADRVTVLSGSFFESVPVGGDAYLLKHIIHDWDEEKATTILKNCHQAMPQHSKLLLFEIVITPGNEPSFGKLLDLNMLVMAGGRERTEEEYRALLQAAGFQLTRIIPTSSPLSIIEAVKV
ncbi:methyltransferase [Nostoc sp. 106C]|uniref:methyltransferase n=1 Tax=Nostoc sp. 106C TaxID=1932667 RepID=UPI000A3A71F6|nr:methyltransferase [Nostoc sp. 106C]OUL26428.1 methyltransferase [Nostoc sp. 106C]